MNYKYKFAATAFALFLSLGLSSCYDEAILDEAPKGFLSPGNTFIDKAGFESALADLYRQGRGTQTVERFSGEGDKALSAIYGGGTDLAWYWDKKLNFADYSIINSSNPLCKDLWINMYVMIKDANVIISRIKSTSLTEKEKAGIEAEARFFRAFAYRTLVYLFGGVPIISEEITEPRFDYARETKKAVLEFMKADLEFASSNLPKANPGNGKLAAAAADHYLAETLISLGQFDQAIAAASRVIDDGQYRLMSARFGKHTGKAGDVFWDLFRLGNQNGVDGNKESILVWQMEYGVNGGNNATYSIERTWGPYLEQLKDSKGGKAILPADSLGRSIGFLRPSEYLETTIWKSDFNNDIRNSHYNMQRQFYNNNPASAEFNKVITPSASELTRNYFVWVKKAASPEGHPQGYDSGGKLYTDIYAIRLAETYLVRAEAYLAKNNTEMAAADINVIRNRAHATPVKAADVDMDFLLDERARELVVEEPRRITLARVGKLYERTKKYNPVSALTIQPFHELLPIPQSVIDANSQRPFEQNPGYL